MKLRKSSCLLFAATALALAGCGESDSTTTYTNPVPDLLLTAGQQERKAAGAKGSADMSLKDATAKATMLSAVKVMGESSDAEANAQAILAAKGKVDSALTEANAALTALQEAKTKADALPADTPKLEELKAELAKAITEATAHRAAIQALKDATGPDSLAKLMEKVTGTGGKKMTPADIAAAVAQEVEKAMVFKKGFTNTYPAITGGKTPVVTTGYFTPSSPIGIANKKVQDAYSGYKISGLPGVRIITTDYARYGYWLAVTEKKDAILETYFFGLPHRNTTIDDERIGNNPTWGNSATYSGKALGMSVLTERNGRNHKAIKSGEFTADVELNATFGRPSGFTAVVEGTIDNFKGNAVGPDWSVDLKEARLNEGAAANFNADYYGLTRGSGGKHDGTWFARAAWVFSDTERPTSITGVFQSFFADGRAAGGYATVKDE